MTVDITAIIAYESKHCFKIYVHCITAILTAFIIPINILLQR